MESPTETLIKNTQKKLNHISHQYKEAMDPDCKWRKKKSSSCKNSHADITRHFNEIANHYSKETHGYFNIRRHQKAPRDFSGLSQGYVIDQIKTNGHYVIDFSGDIYLSENYSPSRPFRIGDPKLPIISFATIHMKSGWMITSGSKKIGADIYDPVQKTKKQDSSFLTLTLFAHPKFKGSRLDAWTTGIVAGGPSLLKKMWQNKKFKGQWAYFYFDEQGRPHCSENLECDFKSKERWLRVPSWSSNEK